MGTLRVKDPVNGWVSVGGPGPTGPPGSEGPEGPPGPTGISSVIIGDFGTQTTPADLPPDGLIPIDWDGPGQPAVAYQVEPGQSLYYDEPADPQDGHLFQYVGTAINSAGWIDVGLIQGPPGPAGPAGPQGPGIPGGTTGQALVKLSDADNDAGWDTAAITTAWATRVLGGALTGGSAHYCFVGPLVAIKFSVNKGTNNIGDGQHIADFPAPPYALWFFGASASGGEVKFHMTALGQVYVRSGGATTAMSSAFTYPKA
jgi:hypothetical protein